MIRWMLYLAFAFWMAVSHGIAFAVTAYMLWDPPYIATATQSADFFMRYIPFYSFPAVCIGVVLLHMCNTLQRNTGTWFVISMIAVAFQFSMVACVIYCQVDLVGKHLHMFELVQYLIVFTPILLDSVLWLQARKGKHEGQSGLAR